MSSTRSKERGVSPLLRFSPWVPKDRVRAQRALRGALDDLGRLADFEVTGGTFDEDRIWNRRAENPVRLLGNVHHLPRLLRGPEKCKCQWRDRRAGACTEATWKANLDRVRQLAGDLVEVAATLETDDPRLRDVAHVEVRVLQALEAELFVAGVLDVQHRGEALRRQAHVELQLVLVGPRFVRRVFMGDDEAAHELIAFSCRTREVPLRVAHEAMLRHALIRPSELRKHQRNAAPDGLLVVVLRIGAHPEHIPLWRRSRAELGHRSPKKIHFAARARRMHHSHHLHVSVSSHELGHFCFAWADVAQRRV
eukprot:scaffold1661_cov251-Pinguiococcus_pyrenoidosus.AAC.21